MQEAEGVSRRDICPQTSSILHRLVLVHEVHLVSFGVDLQNCALCRHLERTSVGSVVLGQRDAVTIDLRDRLLTLNRHDADVHVRAGVHLVVAVDFLLTVIGHGRGTVAILVDDQPVVTLLTLLGSALLTTFSTTSAVAT